MIKVIILFIALMLPMVAKANLTPQEFGYKLCNHHKFTFLLLKAYDVYLCANNKEYLYPEEIFKTNFSIIINYNMNFDKGEILKASIKEINRYYNINKKEQNQYYSQLTSIFPDIKKGDIIEAKYNKDGVVSFYYNKFLTGEITETKFSKIFLDIWLYKDNKYKSMTKDLFKKSE
jgi:hypothetical protein